MSARDAFPILYVDDVAAAERRYVETFGFERTFQWPEDGEPLDFVFLRLPPLGIGLVRRAVVTHGVPVDFELCIYVDDADTATAALAERGGGVLEPPQDRPWAERNATVEMPDGHVVHVAEKLR